MGCHLCVPQELFTTRAWCGGEVTRLGDQAPWVQILAPLWTTLETNFFGLCVDFLMDKVGIVTLTSWGLCKEK